MAHNTLTGKARKKEADRKIAVCRRKIEAEQFNEEANSKAMEEKAAQSKKELSQDRAGDKIGEPMVRK